MELLVSSMNLGPQMLLVCNRSPQQLLPTMRLLPPLACFMPEPSLTACQVQSDPMRQSSWHMPPRRRRCSPLSLAMVESTACTHQQRPMPRPAQGMDLQVLCQPCTAQQSAASLLQPWRCCSQSLGSSRVLQHRCAMSRGLATGMPACQAWTVRSQQMRRTLQSKAGWELPQL